jgi:hypothetical protein
MVDFRRDRGAPAGKANVLVPQFAIELVLAARAGAGAARRTCRVDLLVPLRQRQLARDPLPAEQVGARQATRDIRVGAHDKRLERDQRQRIVGAIAASVMLDGLGELETLHGQAKSRQQVRLFEARIRDPGHVGKDRDGVTGRAARADPAGQLSGYPVQQRVRKLIESCC